MVAYEEVFIIRLKWKICILVGWFWHLGKWAVAVSEWDPDGNIFILFYYLKEAELGKTMWERNFAAWQRTQQWLRKSLKSRTLHGVCQYPPNHIRPRVPTGQIESPFVPFTGVLENPFRETAVTIINLFFPCNVSVWCLSIIRPLYENRSIERPVIDLIFHVLGGDLPGGFYCMGMGL